MRPRRWRGTILFVVILIVLGLTIGLRLLGSGAAPGGVSALASPSPSGTAASPQPSPSAAPTSSSAPAPSPAPAAPAAPRTIDGDPEQTPYGAIQVAVTFSGTTITSTRELQSPNEGGRSGEINSYAAPSLKKEVISAQSARIDTVSGATYTSQGYAQSVQSAIDKS
jgi:uncharacterized protein with FMN-binding domain